MTGYIDSLMCNFDQVHVEFSDEKDSVSLEGPPQEVEKAQESLETFIRELVSKQYTWVTH